MGKISNVTNISLPMAVWLASDDYDFRPQGKAISATALLKPPRQILLRERLRPEDVKTPDVTDFIASRMGTSIHDGIEKAWLTNYEKCMRLLGYPQQVIESIRINPGDLEEGEIPIYLERRGSREIMGYTISGKFDLVLNGELNDFKSTSVYTYVKGSKDEDYCLQGSIYRWIHQDIVTEDTIAIQFIFTDWQRAMAKSDPKYPQTRVLEHRVPLMSLEETEQWIRSRLRTLEEHAELPESKLPYCSDKDLWRTDTVWKYYADPAKSTDPKARSTKNFDTALEANNFRASKGKGIVVEKKGVVKACGYCAAFPICSQKDQLTHG